MHQPYLNLIPEAHREILRRERNFYLIHTVVGILVVVLAVNAILLLVARFVLVGYANTLKDDTSLVSVRHSTLQLEIARVNKVLEDTAAIQRDFAKYSTLMHDVASAMPAGITLDFLYASAASDTVRLTGAAASRDALVAAKNALDNMPAVESVESPLENFLEKENSGFRFNAVLSAGAYRGPGASH